jgi:anaerobic magnesium-protoporphyrin IX monomethyl ester cyclase
LAKKNRKIGVFLGIENASETGLLALCRRTNVSNNQNALLTLHKKGVSATYNLLIFHPKATPEEIRENVKFMNSFDVFPYDFGRAEVCAGTSLECMLKKENKLKGEWPNWDYEIENEQVNRMCQIYKKTFRDKNTAYGHMVHLNIALGYNAKLIERLHPGTIQMNLTNEAEGLIININKFIGKQVSILSSSLDRNWKEKEISEFRENLEKGCKERIKLMEDINQKITNLVLAEHIFSKFGIKEKTQKALNYLSNFNLLQKYD